MINVHVLNGPNLNLLGLEAVHRVMVEQTRQAKPSQH